VPIWFRAFAGGLSRRTVGRKGAAATSARAERALRWFRSGVAARELSDSLLGRAVETRGSRYIKPNVRISYAFFADVEDDAEARRRELIIIDRQIEHARRTANQLRGVVARNAPVLTGRLRRSVRTKVIVTGRQSLKTLRIRIEVRVIHYGVAVDAKRGFIDQSFREVLNSREFREPLDF